MRVLALLLLIPICALASDQPDYAAWAGKAAHAHGRWTSITEQAVKASTLPSEEPRDVGRFCPAYATLLVDDRVRFWVGLISAIASEESNFRPREQYVEPTILADGKHEISYGLLQLSPKSASQKVYGCGKMTAELLMNAGVNLRCGTKQLAYQVKRRGVITSETKTRVGAGRVFSTLWPEGQKGKANEIIGFTSKLPFCRAAHVSH
jgi:hypothetical protein